MIRIVPRRLLNIPYSLTLPENGGRSEHQRLDAGIRWLHFLDENHDSIFITLAIDDHNGNQLRDYRRSEQPFLDLRTELNQEPHGENEY